MSLLDALDRRSRRFAFARRVPPQQIGYRLWSRLRDRVGGVRVPVVLGDLQLKECSALPRLLFDPRAINVQRLGDGWQFSFLQRSVTMPMLVDWRAPGTGPRDQLWRMNLHYFEYLEALPVDDGAALIEQWIAANPVTRPGALSDAWNSYALSLRLVCWLHWLAHYGDNITSSLKDTVGRSIAEQALFLERHLELDIGGNHLVKNIKALLLVAKAFDGETSDRWHQLGLGFLRREMNRQVLDDGVHFELSPSYHCQVTADLIEACAVLPVEQCAPLLPKLAAMTQAATLLAHPDGLSAQFNDAGLTMAYPPKALEQAAIRAGFVVDREMPTTSWLAESGFLAWHDGDDCLIVKGHRIAPDALPAHGHGDLGSVEISIDGARCFVDQGVFEYVDGERREQSRTAACHNVTQVGPLDQAAFFGAFRMGWRARGTACVTIGHDGSAKITAQHNGFERACGLLHRTIEAHSERILIRDHIDRVQGQPVVSRLLLHPDWDVSVEEERLCLSRNGTTVTLSVVGAVPAVVPAVWWPDMGAELPTHRLLFTWLPTATAMQLTLSWDKRATL
jgi:uncharacterized heparinase superfamily protein